MKKQIWQALAAFGMILICVFILDRITNRVDTVEGHVWDFIYYIDMAKNGVWGNDHLAVPYAYRFITPLLAREINLTLNQPTWFGFKVITYLGVLSGLLGVYFLGRKFKFSFKNSLLITLVVIFSLFNVKFLMFDLYRPDPLAYSLLAFSLLALLSNVAWLAIVLSLVGLLIREVSIIPLLACIYQNIRLFISQKANKKPLWISLLIAAGIIITLGLPRALIPVTFTQQILDPINDPNFLNVLFGTPLNWRRDINLVYNLLGYFMPLLILATPSRLKKAWTRLGSFQPVMIIYALVILAMMMYGGTDMMRYVTYFFIPQALLIGCILEEGVHPLEAIYLFTAMILFNRLWQQFPIWDFNAYLDFWGGYADRLNINSLFRAIELFAFVLFSPVLRYGIAKIQCFNQKAQTKGY